MSAGYMVICAGLGILGLAVIMTVIVVIKAPMARKKMQKELAERY